MITDRKSIIQNEGEINSFDEKKNVVKLLD